MSRMDRLTESNAAEQATQFQTDIQMSISVIFIIIIRFVRLKSAIQNTCMHGARPSLTVLIVVVQQWNQKLLID
jgi:hypothetical protein